MKAAHRSLFATSGFPTAPSSQTQERGPIIQKRKKKPPHHQNHTTSPISSSSFHFKHTSTTRPRCNNKNHFASRTLIHPHVQANTYSRGALFSAVINSREANGFVGI